MSYLPIEPLREWIEKQLRFTDKSSLADRMGVDPRKIYSWLYEVERVQLDVADRALLAADVHLWELWPPDVPVELNKAPRILLCDELILRARDLYELGASMPNVAAKFYEESGYSTTGTLAAALYQEFRNQGWGTRTRGEARKQMHREGWTPPRRCRAQTRRGNRCSSPCLSGREHCRFHDPTTGPIGQQTAALASLAARVEDGLPLAPFAAWLRRRVTEAGGQRKLAKRLGLHGPEIARWIKGRRADQGPIGWVERKTVERLLALDRTTTIEDLYPEEKAA